MPNVPSGAKTTDLAPMVAQMRQQGAWGRLTAAARYFITGVTPETWMSPNQPVDPVAQQAFGRNRNYPVGYNLYWTPRGGELSSFAQLRALADNCDLVRLAIETRKDQIAALPWSIANVDDQADDSTDPRIKQVEQLLKRPDGILGWSAWVRQLVEEMLVIDAATVLPRKRNNGQMYGFEIIDGATIKPLIDADGRMPQPPSPAYQQALHGMPAVDYTAAELVYRPRNLRAHKFYGYSPVEQIMMTVNIAIRRALSQLQYYTEGNIPAMMATVPADWQPGQIREFQEYWDSVIEGQQGVKRKMRFVPGGMKAETLVQPPLKDEFDEWLARVVCFAFSLPPTAFVKQNNRATAENQQETAEKEGLQPLTQWLKELMDYLVQVHLGFADLEFTWVEQEVNDPAGQMAVLTAYQKTGVYSVNEVREKLGEDPVTDDGGDEHFIITATGAVPLKQPEPQPVDPSDPNAPPNGKPKPGEPPGPKGKGGVAKRAPLSIAESIKAMASASMHVHAMDARSVADVLKRAPHSHKPDDSPLTPDMVKVKDAFVVALGEIRDATLAQVNGVAKAAGGDGSKPDVPKHDDEWWLTLADRIDLSGLSLAYDDYNDTVVAVTQDGARTEVARLVADDPSLQGAANGAGYDMFDVKDPNAIEWARVHVADMLGTDGSGGKIAESTRDMIRQAIAKAIDESEDRAAIAEMLQNAYAFSEQRAELIARTEVNNALGAGSWIGAKAVGMEQKRWLLSQDEGVCPLCEANAAQEWITIGEAFTSGAQYPLQHPNCRCSAAYRRKPKED